MAKSNKKIPPGKKPSTGDKKIIPPRIRKTTIKSIKTPQVEELMGDVKATDPQPAIPANETPAAKKKRIALENLSKASGFDKNPQNINRNGSNAGSKWKSSLLKDLMSMKLDEDSMKQFTALKKFFPRFFKDTEEKNFQFFMELKQMSLIFSKHDQVSQKAIDSIKDRLEGKPMQKIEQETKHSLSDEIQMASWLDQFTVETDRDQVDNPDQ